MAKEEQLLTTSIRDSFHEAHKVAEKIIYLAHGLNAENVNDPDPEMEDTDELFRWYLTKLYRDVSVLAERMRLPRLARRIMDEFDAIEHPTNLHITNDGPISAHLQNIRGHFETLATMTQGTEVTGLDVFRTILENTHQIVELTSIDDPTKESDVQRAVMKVLKIAFPDATRDPSLGHIFKSYKPDFGVPSLMAAAEYKFATDLAEVRRSLDEIYTDMKGYSGHDEWRTFFAVIYTTDNLVNPKDIEAEFLSVGADVNWSPIIVIGKGARVVKAPRAKPGPKPKSPAVS